jgi:ATP-dependent Clp protease adapter protein ClpS
MKTNTVKEIRIDKVHTDFDHKPIHSGSGIDGFYQVVLFNDEVNTCEYVMACLIRVFNHSEAMAKKIMMEAHQKGKTIAQVERQIEAIGHAAMLKAAGLQTEVEKI